MNIYYVKADDNKTDTTIVAESKAKAMTLMAGNKFWRKNKLVPLIIRKIGVVKP